MLCPGSCLLLVATLPEGNLSGSLKAAEEEEEEEECSTASLSLCSYSSLGDGRGVQRCSSWFMLLLSEWIEVKPRFKGVLH